MLTASLKGTALAAISFVFCLSTSALAQASAGQPAAAGDGAELAKKLSNPISDLVSVPFSRKLEFNNALDVLFDRDDATELLRFLSTCTLPG